MHTKTYKNWPFPAHNPPPNDPPHNPGLTLSIRTVQDERNQHVVLVAQNGTERVYARSYSAHVAAAIAATLHRDLSRGCDWNWADTTPAEFRTTKSGRRMLLATT